MSLPIPTTRTVACLNPFNWDRKTFRLPAWLSVAEILQRIEAHPEAMDYTVQVDGRPIPSADWDAVRPGPDSLLAVRAAPAGSPKQGKDAARIAAGIAMLGLLNPVGMIAGKILGAALPTWALWATRGASMLHGIFANMPSQDELQKSNKPEWQWRNSMTPYGTIPRVYGRVRLYPPLAAKPYLHSVGNKHHYYVLYCVGYGPLSISDVKIGDDPITSIDGITHEVVDHYPDDETRTIVPPVVHEQEFDIAQFTFDENLDSNSAETDQHTDDAMVKFVWPYGLGAEVDRDATYIDPETGFRRRHSGAGHTYPVSVTIICEARSYAGGSWGSWQEIYETELGTTRIQPRARTTAYYSEAFHFDLHEAFSASQPEKYELRFTQWQSTIHWPSGWGEGSSMPLPSSDEYTRYDDFSWVKLDSLEWTDPIREDHIDPTSNTKICSIGLRIDADKWQAVAIDRLNCVAHAELLAWNQGASEWQVALHRGVATAFRDVLQGQATRRSAAGFVNPYIPDARLDLTSIQAWDEWCDGKSLTFNHVFDRQITVRQALETICAAGFASPQMVDGKYGVVYDYDRNDAGDDVVQNFTPRNSWGFTATRRLPEKLHGIRARYIKEGTDYSFRHTERLVTHDDYSRTSATNVQRIDFPGVTDADQIDKLCWYHIKNAWYRLETWQINCDIENLVCTRGDLVTVSHDVPLIGNKRGRIIDRTLDGSNRVTHVTLDEEVYIDSNDFLLRVRSASMTASPYISSYRTPNLVNANDWVTQVQFSTPIGPAGASTPVPEIDDLFLFGEETVNANVEQFYLVAAVMPNDELTATLTLIEECAGREGQANVYSDGTQTSYEPDCQEEPWPEALDPPPIAVHAIKSDESVMIRRQDGTFQERIVLFVTYTTGVGEHAPIDHAETQYRVTPEAAYDDYAPWTQGPNAAAYAPEIDFRDVEMGVTYDVRVRTRSAEGRASVWTTETDITVEGWSAPPPDPGELTIENDGVCPILRWTYTDGPPMDLAGFEIRHHCGDSAGWDYAERLNAEPTNANMWALSPQPQGTFTFYVKAVDCFGNYSTNAASLKATFGDPGDVPNLETTAIKDWQADGWPGTFDNCTPIAGEIRQDDEDSVATYTSGWWLSTAALGYSDAVTIIVPTITVSSDSWWVEYQTNWNLASETWHHWPGRVTLRPYLIGSDLRISIRFRISMGPNPGGQGVISALNIKRGYPMIAEIWTETNQIGDASYPHTCTRGQTHMCGVSGMIIGTSQRSVEQYVVTYSEWNAGVGAYYIVTEVQESDGGGDCGPIDVRWIASGYRHYQGPTA